MEKSFTGAANPAVAKASDRLTISTDWQGTVMTSTSAGTFYNFPHLEELCKLQGLGHTVIITSTSQALVIEDNLEIAVEFGEIENYALQDAYKFQIIPKQQLMQMVQAGLITVDVAYDDEEIATQTIASLRDRTISPLNYANPKLEIRVNPDFAKFPMDVKAIRAQIDALIETKQATVALPEPHP